MVTCTGHIGIHEGADGRTYVRTDVDDVMAIKPNFLTSMGYHIFLTMVLRTRAKGARGAPLLNVGTCKKPTKRPLGQAVLTDFKRYATFSYVIFKAKLPICM